MTTQFPSRTAWIPFLAPLRLCALIASLASVPLSGAGFDDPTADREVLPSVPAGFTVTFFAREPMVRQPCSMAFDARGRLCVGMGPQYRNPKPATPGDSVVLVLDTDGDGKADRTKVFATGFNAIQAMAWHGRDLWVANSPDLTVVRDLDGDDEADEYVLVYTDLGNLEHGLHGLNWAPDGRLYMSKGNSKGLTQPGRIAPKPFRDLWGVTAPPGSPDFPPPKTFRKGEYKHAYHDPEDDWGREGGVLRCAPDGSQLEIIARGFRNPWDITPDSGFNWLGTDNDQVGGDRVFMPFRGAHFGWNHPWSADWGDTPDSPVAPVSGPLFEGSGTGLIFCDSPAFPAAYRRVFFINDWLSKTTYLWRPQWDGAMLRPSGGAWEPFVVGGKSLFRPTDIEVGPDGALWVLGWSSGYGAVWKNGELSNEGRVFRVATPACTRDWRTPKRSRPMAQWTVAELIEDFDGPLPVWRTDAQEELVRRGSTTAQELVRALQAGRLTEFQETWTAWTLARLGLHHADIRRFFEAALAYGPPVSLNLRIQSLRILADLPHKPGPANTLPANAIAQLQSPEPRLRMAAVEGLTQARPDGFLRPLTALLDAESDRTVFYAGWQALRSLASPAEVRSLLADARAGVRRAALLALLEDHRLKPEEVVPFTRDQDGRVRSLADRWMKKAASGSPTALIRGRPLQGAVTGLRAPTNAVPGASTPLRTAVPVPPLSPTTVESAMQALAKGDRKRGESLFDAEGGAGCALCHRLGGRGNAFGPDLAALGDRTTARHIVQSILEPNAVITEGFNLQMIKTADDEFSGILLEESGISLALGLATGQRIVLPKGAITSRRTAPTSAMPSFESALSPQDVADLTAYLLAQTGPALTSGKPAAPARPGVTGFRAEMRTNAVIITHSGQPVAEFLFRDPQVLRPAFANVHAPDGTLVTRNHPPVPGVDAADHATMHPGVWLGFGDISGEDFWRNKAVIRHDRFIRNPEVRGGVLEFATESTLLARSGSAMARLRSDVSIQARPGAYVLDWEARFTPLSDGFSFGDQEEMGFGARVATPLTEKAGGVITSSSGETTARATWGRPYLWCDYSRVIDGHRIGIVLMPAPGNMRPSWWHNRDYGVFVANPFGREAMKQGPRSVVPVRRGETFRLRFGAAVYAIEAQGRVNPESLYHEYCASLGPRNNP